ncbi:MAG: bacteriohemerythrin [Nitrospirota bacterium]|jgi:hemerythrin-like metal-binding protein
MPLVVWSAKYSLGIEAVDSQHKSIVDLINRLHASLRAGEAKRDTGEILRRMRDYALLHFDMEEKYMEEFGYGGLEEHRAEHETFRRKVPEFERSFREGDLTVTLEIMRFLMDWLLRHIQVVDRKYAPLFKERGL